MAIYGLAVGMYHVVDVLHYLAHAMLSLVLIYALIWLNCGKSQDLQPERGDN